ncbi:MAG: hypothetical protein GY949_05785, partial [Gammaproteobacteria bacterium]|nr:hypothetical protein [Gammaproteobacteria bacterium]
MEVLSRRQLDQPRRHRWRERVLSYERTHGSASASLPRSYERRKPEKSALYPLVAEHAETLFAEAQQRTEHGYGYPLFVEQTFRQYLDCGQLQNGFTRLRCAGCGFERLLAFSCKRRGLCPSCEARRMEDTAAHLV